METAARHVQRRAIALFVALDLLQRASYVFADVASWSEASHYIRHTLMAWCLDEAGLSHKYVISAKELLDAIKDKVCIDFGDRMTQEASVRLGSRAFEILRLSFLVYAERFGLHEGMNGFGGRLGSREQCNFELEEVSEDGAVSLPEEGQDM